MVELTIDGKQVSVPEGSMVMHAAHELGVYVPHFCYHKKLSIAANCRMCLVEVDKIPKAVPACATPVTSGMVVHTCSAKAVAAQKSVMEFLLINHPLDCPICDQGGECQLQDLAVGYGQDKTRYAEEKRVVFQKNLGPLVSAQEMSRCIQCTRCVRFGQEVAGNMELGMINRGEQSQITSFVGRALESELSGNMIDICPVGALTSKPFRYSARTWELARRRTVSPHDSLGTNIIAQVKSDKVIRVVPFENEQLNECWISDKDRWSYEGLNDQDRLTTPMIKGDDGQWREASWEEALTATAQSLSRINETFGTGQIAALSAEYATVEEMFLLARLTRALGSENIDFRLRQNDVNLDASLTGAPWLGMPVTELNQLTHVVVVGSFLRKDHPLLAQRLRQAQKMGAKIILIDSCADEQNMPIAHRITTAPANYANYLAQINNAVTKVTLNGQIINEVETSEQAQAIARDLVNGGKIAVLLGNSAVNAPDASLIAANAQALAKSANATLGFLTSGANTVGGYLVGATPVNDGLNFAQMLNNQLKAYIVLHADPLLDADNGVKATKMLQEGFSIALTSYRSSAQDWARIMLPVAPFTETSGTFVNAEGRAQSFKGVVPGLGQSRPAWKVLRVLGNILKFSEFIEESSEAVRDEALCEGFEQNLSNEIKASAACPKLSHELQRVADVPIFRTDAIARHAESLQASQANAKPAARMNAQTMQRLGLQDGDAVRVKSDVGGAFLHAQLDDLVAHNTVRIAASFEQTAALGSAFSEITVERA